MKIKSFRELFEEMSDDDLEKQTVPTHKVIKDLKVENYILLKKGDYVFLDREGLRCFVIEGLMEESIVDFMDDTQVDEHLQEMTDTDKNIHKYSL
jgi:hypothetical protein